MKIEWEHELETLSTRSSKVGKWELVYTYKDDNRMKVCLSLYASKDSPVSAIRRDAISIDVKNEAHAERIIKAIEGEE